MAAPITTARITPELFKGNNLRKSDRVTALIVSLILLSGLGFRMARLGSEGLSEDELNKLVAVQDYRAHGVTAANGEHPMLMKAMLTVSSLAIEKWNGAVSQSLSVSTESALRLPGAIFGALVCVLLFLIVGDLFGTQIGLLAAAFWAFDPSAIAFSRIAKEDIFLLFFFLLANLFWLRSQRIAETGKGRPEPYYWATAAAFGAMMASKYLFHFFAISVSYYWIFQTLPVTTCKWRLGPRKWLMFFIIMGATFLACNPGILLPGTWREIMKFAGEHRIGHDAYEFMGRLYHNQMTLWLRGSPWYFYYVFMGVKLPVLELGTAAIGLVLLFRKQMGDGRYFVLFWLMLWFLPFTVLGGKFTRYFTMGLPAVLIAAAIGTHYVARWVAQAVASKNVGKAANQPLGLAICAAIVLFSAVAAITAMPHYRLYTNVIGGGAARAGTYFPHDEFYDSSMRDTVSYIAAHAGPNVRVASETPTLVKHYADLDGRSDLSPVSLSDQEALKELAPGDFIVIAQGRRYFSNDALIHRLAETTSPVNTIQLGNVNAVDIYVLNAENARAVNSKQ